MPTSERKNCFLALFDTINMMMVNGNNANPTITVGALTTAPVSGDTFSIV